VTTPTSRRRDVRASTATAPAADEERGAQFSPALAKKRENGCRLLLLRYTSGRQPPSNYLGRAVFFSRVSPPRGEFSPATPRGNHPHDPLPFSHPPALSLSLLFLRHHLSLAVSPALPLFRRTKPPSPPVHHRRHYPTIGFPTINHPPRTPYPPPSTLPRALPASSDPHGHDREPRPTESCRFSASQPSDSPPRHAARSVCFSASRFKSLRA